MFDAELVGTLNGYECRYYPTIGDGPVFRWKPWNHAGDFEVSASRNGVMLSGHSSALDAGRVGSLAEVLDLASDVARKLERVGSGKVDSVKEFIASFDA